MPKEILDHASEKKIEFVWTWFSGYEYGPGVTIFDGKQEASFDTGYSGAIVLDLDEIENDALKDARLWDMKRLEIIRGDAK